MQEQNSSIIQVRIKMIEISFFYMSHAHILIETIQLNKWKVIKRDLLKYLRNNKFL